MALIVHKDYEPNISPVNDLCNAIALQAVKDYRELVELIIENPVKDKSYYEMYTDISREMSKNRKEKDRNSLERNRHKLQKMKKLYESPFELRSLRRFFLDGTFSRMTDIDGEQAMKAIDESYPNFDAEEYIRSGCA